jgi:hypothetical protein
MANTAVPHIDQVAVRQCWIVELCVQNVHSNVTSVWQCSEIIKKNILFTSHAIPCEEKINFPSGNVPCLLQFTCSSTIGLILKFFSRSVR